MSRECVFWTTFASVFYHLIRNITIKTVSYVSHLATTEQTFRSLF